MSVVSESMNRRMTLGLLASRYGFDLDPAFATEVTVTSIADDIDSVRPGALFMPSMQVDEQQLRQVQALGAYGAVQSVNVDVLGCDDKGLSEAEIVKSVARFGCTVGKQTHIAGRTQESDALAAQAAEAYGQADSSALSLSIAMVLAAGVRKANIKSALRVSRDLN